MSGSFWNPSTDRSSSWNGSAPVNPANWNVMEAVGTASHVANARAIVA